MNMLKHRCCVWGCNNTKGKCPEDVDEKWICDCPIPRVEGCHRRKYSTLHSIANMPEHVRRAEVEKINHTQQGLQRTKWNPVYFAYPDFKGPSRGYSDVLTIYFRRPTSYPTTTSAPKKRRMLERRPPVKKSIRSSL